MGRYTSEQLMAALEMAVEQLLRQGGATDEGVEAHLADATQTYLDMAAGKREPFLGSRFRGRATRGV